MEVTIDTSQGDAVVEVGAMTVPQMKAFAAANNIPLDGLTVKKDIQARIEAAMKERADAQQPQTAEPEAAADTTQEAPEAGEPPAADTEQKPPEGGSFEVARVLKITKPLVKGEDVKALQNALIARGFGCGADGATGIYERNTAQAVRHFQSMNRLIVDGRAGKFTVTALGGTWKE